MLILTAAALQNEPEDWTEWHPETLEEVLAERYGARPSPENLDRLMAGLVLLKTEYFWQEPRRFNDLANVLSGARYRPEIFDPVTAAEAAWAVAEAMVIEPPERQPAPEIITYLTKILRDEGYLKPPQVLAAVGVPDGTEMLTQRWADRPEEAAQMLQAARQRATALDQAVREELDELFTQIRGLELPGIDMAAAIRPLQEALLGRHHAGTG